MSNFFLHQTPRWLQAVFPEFSWQKPQSDKIIHLTFDDGPVPEATPKVMDWLREFDAKATFFCVGENISKHPEIFHQLIKEGHAVGNHTFHHLNGWKSSREVFLKDTAQCQELLTPYQHDDRKPLMRPPYGRLKRNQWRPLLEEYEIVMWDVLTGDFSDKVDAESCLKKSKRYTKSGSIVLFHDSIKTIEKLRYVLPAFLQHFSRLGYSFQSL